MKARFPLRRLFASACVVGVVVGTAGATVGIRELQPAAAPTIPLDQQTDGALPGKQRSTSSTAYVCSTGRRIELFYAHPHDVPDRYAEGQQDIVEFFYWAANALTIRAKELSGKGVKIPTKCDANGKPAVQKVESDYSAGDIPGKVSSDTSLREERIQKGLTDPNVKYWFWWDDPKGDGGGRAGMIPMCQKAKDAGGTGNCDDRPTANNWFNRGGSDFYANTWGGDGGGGTMLHEAFHLWGAVQYTAPNSSNGGHCVDENDLMCYSDAPDYPAMRNVCETTEVDCNSDDYFHPSPPDGSYLATKWNPAGCSNYFLRVEGCTYPDPATDPPAPPGGKAAEPQAAPRASGPAYVGGRPEPSAPNTESAEPLLPVASPEASGAVVAAPSPTAPSPTTLGSILINRSAEPARVEVAAPPETTSRPRSDEVALAAVAAVVLLFVGAGLGWHWRRREQPE